MRFPGAKLLLDLRQIIPKILEEKKKNALYQLYCTASCFGKVPGRNLIVNENNGLLVSVL